MATNPQPVAGGFMNLLSKINAGVSLGLVVENNVLPLIVGLIKDVKSRVSGDTVEYTIVLSSQHALLDNVIAKGGTTIDEINAELAKAGHPPLANPATADHPAPQPGPGPVPGPTPTP